MKIGIILLFSNNEKDIKETHFQKLSENTAIKFCFINNASEDNTLETLKSIKNESIKNISIIDIKIAHSKSFTSIHFSNYFIF